MAKNLRLVAVNGEITISKTQCQCQGIAVDSGQARQLGEEAVVLNYEHANLYGDTLPRAP